MRISSSNFAVYLFKLHQTLDSVDLFVSSVWLTAFATPDWQSVDASAVKRSQSVVKLVLLFNRSNRWRRIANLTAAIVVNAYSIIKPQAHYLYQSRPIFSDVNFEPFFEWSGTVIFLKENIDKKWPNLMIWTVCDPLQIRRIFWRKLLCQLFRESFWLNSKFFDWSDIIFF